MVAVRFCRWTVACDIDHDRGASGIIVTCHGGSYLPTFDEENEEEGAVEVTTSSCCLENKEVFDTDNRSKDVAA
jgi:hypothetical protein